MRDLRLEIRGTTCRMENELDVLVDVAERLERAGFDYMLTGSLALNYYAQPRMTRDIDVVLALVLRDVTRLEDVFGAEYYLSPDAAKEAVLHQSSFNAIHQRSMIKVDLIIRKREEYRLEEFGRRHRVSMAGKELWIVSKEDLILSKLEWARESLSQRQLTDVRNLLATDCDLDYLWLWASRLNLTDILTQVSP